MAATPRPRPATELHSENEVALLLSARGGQITAERESWVEQALEASLGERKAPDSCLDSSESMWRLRASCRSDAGLDSTQPGRKI